MKHIEKISQFLYFQLTSVFLLLIYLHNAFPKVRSESFMYLFFAVLLLPILEKVFSGTFSELNSKKYLNSKFMIGVTALIAGIGVLWIGALVSLPLLLLLFLVFTWYYAIDGRVYFLGALLLFLYVMLGLLLGNESLAEGLSIIAYYLLVAGVISQVLENISLPKKTTNA